MKRRHLAGQRILKKFIKSTPSEVLTETLIERRQRLSDMLDQQEEDLLADEVDIDTFTQSCEGPLTLEGTTALGRSVVVRVCGSDAYGETTDTYFVGPGHGQTQHEQVHVERVLHPDEPTN